ncbi:unnamed protein product [Rhizoctonia solani]|uniref:Topoisomerase 6 subunit A/Spo11 TOPRIM domain-containing protein n=1 Tax=Rhizoctonia solani TaxID=456999 RepID=A0A8H3DUL7_9AGAM|nr:unnamed protein product [Rhizoctonia solani]
MATAVIKATAALATSTATTATSTTPAILHLHNLPEKKQRATGIPLNLHAPATMPNAVIKATATLATSTATTATAAAPTIPDVRHWPEKRKHWATDVPPGFPALGDKNWHFSRHYYPPSVNAAAARKNQFNAFLTRFENLAKPGTGGAYSHLNLEGDYVMTSRSLTSGYGLQSFVNVVALTGIDLQARYDDVEYDQRLAWYGAGKPVGMKKEDMNQTVHNLATTFGLTRPELQLKATPTGNEAFLGPIEYYRSDGFLVKGSYECLAEIPDIDDIRALGFMKDVQFIVTFEHHAALSAAKAEGLPQALREQHGHHVMATSGGRASARYKSFVSTLKVLNPNIRILSFGDIDGFGLSVFTGFKFGTIASNYQNSNLKVHTAEYLHVPIDTLIARNRRMGLFTDKDEKEMMRLEVAGLMDQDMARQAEDMQRTGKTASLAVHWRHFIEDLCPIIGQRLFAPPPANSPDVPVENPSLEPLGCDYLSDDACLAQLALIESTEVGDSSFEVKHGSVRAHVEISTSPSTVMLTSLDNDGERQSNLTERHSSMEKVRCGYL